MIEHSLFYFVVLMWLVFAAVQDLRKREISNWLNFSLLSLGLIYRGIIAIVERDIRVFWIGLGGVVFFMSLAYILYYSRAFAGGDAKLLMALGAVLPFESVRDYLFMGLGFVLLVFAVGALWGLIYTGSVAIGRRRKFVREFKRASLKYIMVFFVSFVLGLVLSLVLLFLGYDWKLWGLFLILFVVFPVMFIYAKAVEKSCFISVVNARDLVEGDWLVEDVRVRGAIVRANLHGLNLREIKILRKAGKKVLVKSGVPFAPSFLLAFVLMVFFFSRYNLLAYFYP
jgi:Flp pilus assembly protein protease CpaA